MNWEDLSLRAPVDIHSSDSGLKMKAEFHKIFKLFEELEEAGECATLTISANGGTSTIKLLLESPPSPSTTGTTPRTLPPAPGRRRRHRGAAARARRRQRAAGHQGSALAVPASVSPSPPDPGEASAGPKHGGLGPEAGLPQQGDDAFQCDICGNSFSSDKGLRIHKGRSHKSQELLQPEQMRSQDFVNSKNVSPLKDVREEVTNTQVFQCDAFDSMNHVHCGEVFESEETLEDHTGIVGPLVRCPGCKHFFYDCDDAEACPGCLRPWPGWRSRPR